MKPSPNHPARLSRCLATAFLALLASTSGMFADQTGTSPVKIFILAGQSNMQGHGEISPLGTPGTLEYTVANDPGGDYQFVSDGSGGWAIRDDVWIHYERETSTLLTGSLTAGYGEANTTIGPELGFGSAVGDHYGDQVLLIKAAWGGKSLAVDFRPPSSGGTTGSYYNEILRLVNDATTNLATYFPQYDGQGYEIAGFGWHQGWNDRVNQTYNDEYEANMANFIRDIRIDLGTPNLPFVIATTGMSGWDETHPRALSLMNAQLAVAQHPEFQGNVFTVETRDFWRDPSVSPSPGGNQAYHWNRNAATHLDIGLAMGEAVVNIASNPCPTTLLASGGPGGVTLTWHNGTEIPTSVRILRNSVEIASAAPADPPTFIDTTALPGILNYELIFTMPGDPCDPLTTSFDGSLDGLQAARDETELVLTWSNKMPYTGIVIKRDGLVLEASLSGTAESYTDTSPPTEGQVTYTVAPTTGTSTQAEVVVNFDDPNTIDWHWDTTAGGVGDGVSDGGTGTWDLVTENWDRGPGLTRGAWANATANKATFGGTAGTVTLAQNITLNEINVLAANYNLGDPSEDHILNFGGTAPTILVDDVSGTVITAGITGSPTINYVADGGNNDSVLTLAPVAPNTMDLGTIAVTRTGGNAALWLSGDSAGNSTDLITWTIQSNQLQVRKKGTGIWEIKGDLVLDDGKLFVDEGTLICGGTSNIVSHQIETNGDGKLVAGGTWTINDNREHFVVTSGGTVAPDSSVGPLRIVWNSTRSEVAKVELETGATYEWEVGAGNTTDILDVGKTNSPNVTLEVGDITLKVLDAGGSPSADDHLPVFTYDTNVVRTIGSVNIDLSATGWTGNPTLVDDNAGTIYLTGLSGGGGTDPFGDWAAGFTPPLTGGFGGDYDADGAATGQEWYYFNTDPTVAQGHGSPLKGATKTGANTFAFTHQRPLDRTGISDPYRWSTDLVTWHAAGASVGTYTVGIVAVGDSGAPYENVTVTATVSGGTPNQLFIRQELSYP